MVLLTGVELGPWSISIGSPNSFAKSASDTSTNPNTHDMMTILDEEELIASAVVYQQYRRSAAS